jgi:predicted TIM-barrel fold metal-dependent hydrolase
LTDEREEFVRHLIARYTAGALTKTMYCTNLDRIHNIAQRIADRKWHVQIYATTGLIAEAAPVLADLGIDLVIDHFGSIAGKDL